jgi:CubicO group peptidase (beta-lactamase class C family)
VLTDAVRLSATSGVPARLDAVYGALTGSHRPVVAVAVADGAAPVTTAWGTSPGALFQGGSISKVVAALVTLVQVADGALTLDTPVNELLRSWRLPRYRRQRTEVTVRHLLCHGGAVTVREFAGYPPGLPLPSLDAMLDGRGPANSDPVRVSGRPGRKVWYSSGGFLVLQRLLQDVTGRRYDDLAAATVLRPAGMSDAGHGPPPSAARVAAATGDEPWRVHPELAAAGLWCTTLDVVRLVGALQRSVAGEPGSLIPPDLAAEMVTAQLGDHGFGLRVVDRDGSLHLVAVGRTAGFCAEVEAEVHGGRITVGMASDPAAKPLVHELVRSGLTP